MKQWKLTEGKKMVQTENDAKKLFPKETWNKLHLKLFSTERIFSSQRKSGERLPHENDF